MDPRLFELHATMEDHHWWFSGRREVVHAMIRRVTPSGDEPPLVADVGCGTGATLGWLSGSYRRIGIDPSGSAIGHARRRFPSVEFVQGIAPIDFPMPVSAIDTFLLLDVLEHVEDDFALFSKLFALARPGSHFIVTVPAVPQLWSVHDETFGHFRRYTPGRLTRIWDGLPARTRLLSYFNTRLYPLIRAIRRFNSRKGRAAGGDRTDLELPAPVVNSVLRRILSGEAARLTARMDREDQVNGFRGVSLIAVIRREAGGARIRRRDPHVHADDPYRGIRVGAGVGS